MSAKIDGRTTDANRGKLQGVNSNSETSNVKSKDPQTLGLYFTIYPKYFLKSDVAIFKIQTRQYLI